MARRVLATGAAIVQLKVQLLEVEPAVWRRIQIPAAATMAELHEVLQAVLGWQNCHLHEFETDDLKIGVPDDEWGDEDLATDETGITVGEVATMGARIRYVYDLGDYWQHDLIVESILVAEAEVRYPRCLGGEQACPPEDVGGTHGYDNFLRILRFPDHPDHAMAVHWAGGFHPDEFSATKVDKALARLAWRNPLPTRTAKPTARAVGGTLQLVPNSDVASSGLLLRCTGKLLKVLGTAPKDLVEAPPSPEDWYGNVIYIEGRKCLLVTHAQTLFTVFIPDVLAADLRPIDALLIPALHAALAREGLPIDTFGVPGGGPVRLAKTADRSVLGCLRDLAGRCEWAVRSVGGLANLDLDELHHGLQRNPSSVRNWAFAIDSVRKRTADRDV